MTLFTIRSPVTQSIEAVGDSVNILSPIRLPEQSGPQAVKDVLATPTKMQSTSKPTSSDPYGRSDKASKSSVQDSDGYTSDK